MPDYLNNFSEGKRPCSELFTPFAVELMYTKNLLLPVLLLRIAKVLQPTSPVASLPLQKICVSCRSGYIPIPATIFAWNQLASIGYQCLMF